MCFVQAMRLLFTRLFARDRPRLMASAPVVVLWLVAVVSAAQVGPLSGPMGVALLLAIFAALLFARRTVFALLVALFGAIALMAFLQLSGVLPLPIPADYAVEQASVWFRTGTNAILIIALATAAVTSVVGKLEGSLAAMRQQWRLREQARAERARALELALGSQDPQIMSQIASGLRHDVQAEVFAIELSNEALQEQEEDGVARAGLHATIATAARRLSTLFEELLSFAREHGEGTWEVSTRELLDGMRTTLATLVPEGATLVCECRQECLVSASRLLLQQAILHLVINARDALAPGGQLAVRADAISLERSLRTVAGELAPGRYATIEVEDTGSGMDRQAQACAFEPLFSAKPGGAGLGLPTVLASIRQCGGGVTLWSEPGRGTRVILHLPALEDLGDDSVSR